MTCHGDAVYACSAGVLSHASTVLSERGASAELRTAVVLLLSNIAGFSAQSHKDIVGAGLIPQLIAIVMQPAVVV